MDDQKLLIRVNMTTIGRQKRKMVNQYKLMLPGVGLYDVQPTELNKTRGGSFTRAIRSITQGSKTSYPNHATQSVFSRPGPGSYSLQLRRKQKVSSFPHSKRFATEQHILAPGPADYRSQQSSREKIKAGSICKSARTTFNFRGKVPGPSDYSIPNITCYKKKEPIALFGRAKRVLHSSQRQEDANKVFNMSRERSEKEERSLAQNQISERMNLKIKRAWHGRKIEKQAKRAQQDLLQTPA